MDILAFHDAILQGGTMPIEMVRARLLREAPGRGFRAGWRFSSTSTGPANASPGRVNASRIRWSMNHAVFWLTPMSRCSFMLDTPFRLVSSR